jgi:hypothetical protein
MFTFCNWLKCLNVEAHASAYDCNTCHPSRFVFTSKVSSKVLSLVYKLYHIIQDLLFCQPEVYVASFRINVDNDTVCINSTWFLFTTYVSFLSVWPPGWLSEPTGHCSAQRRRNTYNHTGQNKLCHVEVGGLCKCIWQWFFLMWPSTYK